MSKKGDCDPMFLGLTPPLTHDWISSAPMTPLMLWVRTPFSRGVLDTTFCDKVCQWLGTGHWFSPGSSISPTNKTDCHDIAEILLKVALNTITLTPNFLFTKYICRGQLSKYQFSSTSNCSKECTKQPYITSF